MERVLSSTLVVDNLAIFSDVSWLTIQFLKSLLFEVLEILFVLLIGFIYTLQPMFTLPPLFQYFLLSFPSPRESSQWSSCTIMNSTCRWHPCIGKGKGHWLTPQVLVSWWPEGVSSSETLHSLSRESIPLSCLPYLKSIHWQCVYWKYFLNPICCHWTLIKLGHLQVPLSGVGKSQWALIRDEGKW